MTAERSDDPSHEGLDLGLAVGFGQRPALPSGLATRRQRLVLRDPSRAEATPLLKPLDGGSRDLPRQAGRCQLLGEIARGGIGMVLKGHDADLGRDVAVKLLHERHLGNPAALHRFVEEARIGGQLQHPGVVPVYELGLEEGWPFFTMKLVQGRTVAALLAERESPADQLRRLLSIFEQVCHTVAFAHARGVIHRDLKPANVMVGSFGEVQVVDWGLAKVLEERGAAGEEQARQIEAREQVLATVRGERPGPHTAAGSVLGTPAYMSPEQARGQVDALDERSDVFSLGAMLCEILTGLPPFPQEAEALADAAACRTGPALERLACCGQDPELVALTAACLQALPAARPRDAGVLAERIGSHLAAVEERARQAALAAAEAKARAAAARRAQRLTAGLAFSVLATLCVAGGSWWWITSEASSRRAKTGRSVQEALQDAERWRGQARAASGSGVGLWKDAMAAAHRARALVEASDVEADLRARALALAGRIAGEERAARDHAQQRERDAAMVARLQEIPIDVEENPWGEDRARRELERQADAYRSAFRDYGIDVESQPAETAGVQLRSTAIAIELATAVDWWAMCSRLISRPDQGQAWRQLLAAAMAADPEPWRSRLRQVLLAEVPQERRLALEKLAEEADVRELPPVTVLTLGLALSSHGLRTRAVGLYRAAVALHPSDFSLNSRLALHLGALDPPDHQEALRFHQAALALRPGSVAVRHRLAHALKDAARLEEAIAAEQDVLRLLPEQARAHCCLADTLAESGRLAEAVSAYREAIRLEPGLVWAHNNLGIALKGDGKLQEAVAAYREAIRWQPKLARAHFNLGIALREMGELEEAAAAFREAIRLEPGHADAHNNLGITLRDLNELDEAIAAYGEAIRLRPGHPDAHLNLGVTLRALGKLEEAVSALEEGIRLRPDEAGAHVVLGTVHVEQGKLDQAVAAFRSAIRLRPDDATGHYNLGVALGKLRDLEGAIAAYQETIRLQPSHANAHTNLGSVLRDAGQLEAAIAAYREAIRLEPSQALAHYNLGMALQQQGNLSEAIEAWREAVRLQPDHVDAHYNLGLALGKLGHLSGEIAAYRRVLELDPSFVNAHHNLGIALKQRGRLDESSAALREAIRLRPDRAQSHYVLGLVLEAQRRPDEAIAAFRAAIRAQPTYTAAHWLLGLMLEQRGSHQEAIAAYREVLRLEPRHAQAPLRLGLALLEVGRPDEAIEVLRQTTSTHPDQAEAHYKLGLALLERGRFGEALVALERGHELGSQRPDWQHASAQWVERARALVTREPTLRAILEGGATPASASEALVAARLGFGLRRYVASARAYVSAFTFAPNLGEDPGQRRARYDAACAAALAGCGKGDDAGSLDPSARAVWRDRALGWLNDELKGLEQAMKGPSKEAGTAARHLAHSLADPDLAGVRDAPSLQALPEPERSAWRAHWQERRRALEAAKQD